ncbi:IclR family transcriptional regulator [Salinigranum rubrum]|nr:IclR family transcriptional regulator [Salinigranum rubrum]
MTPDAAPPVKATATTFRVVDALIRLETAGVSELADRLNLSKSAVHSHLTTLEQLGYVVRDEDGSRLSLQFFQVGARVRNRSPLYVVARTEIDQMATMSGLDAGIIVHERNEGMCVYSRVGRDDTEPRLTEGDRVPLHATGPGKAILAALSQTALDRFFETGDREQFTSSTITDEETLREELQDVRSHGLAYENREYDDDVRGIGAAINGGEGEVLGAIFITGTTDTLSGKQLRQNNPGLVISAKNRIENQLQASVTD